MYECFSIVFFHSAGSDVLLEMETADMLHRVWDEIDYRVDVCRVTQGEHIEGL
jgi:hypothetical protein